MSTIRHLTDTRGQRYSRKFISVEKPQSVDTEEIRRQIRLSKDAGHSKMPTYHTVLEKLCEAYDLLNGKPKEDLRRIFGS